mmetsp:Transcript_90376/g.206654  ORF Transcript_90376/g.206654 Transcript_90376/m.206654 type:complete len:798 (-) Transcript_90376:420-2813(-)
MGERRSVSTHLLRKEVVHCLPEDQSVGDVDDDLKGFVHVPPQTSGPLPVVVFLHGIGECWEGEEWLTEFLYSEGPLCCRKVRDSCLVITPHGDLRDQQSRFVLADSRGRAVNFQAMVVWRYVLEVLERLTAEGVAWDPSRVMVTGISLGGIGCWEVAAVAPCVSAVLAVVSDVEETFSKVWQPVAAAALHNVCVVAVVSEDEKSMPEGVERTRDFLSAITTDAYAMSQQDVTWADAEWEETRYEGATPGAGVKRLLVKRSGGDGPGWGHDAIWREAYADAALWDCVLSHRRVDECGEPAVEWRGAHRVTCWIPTLGGVCRDQSCRRAHSPGIPWYGSDHVGAQEFVQGFLQEWPFTPFQYHLRLHMANGEPGLCLWPLDRRLQGDHVDRPRSDHIEDLRPGGTYVQVERRSALVVKRARALPTEAATRPASLVQELNAMEAEDKASRTRGALEAAEVVLAQTHAMRKKGMPHFCPTKVTQHIHEPIAEVGVTVVATEDGQISVGLEAYTTTERVAVVFHGFPEVFCTPHGHLFDRITGEADVVPASAQDTGPLPVGSMLPACFLCDGVEDGVHTVMLSAQGTKRPARVKVEVVEKRVSRAVVLDGGAGFSVGCCPEVVGSFRGTERSWLRMLGPRQQGFQFRRMARVVTVQRSSRRVCYDASLGVCPFSFVPQWELDRLQQQDWEEQTAPYADRGECNRQGWTKAQDLWMDQSEHDKRVQSAVQKLRPVAAVATLVGMGFYPLGVWRIYRRRDWCAAVLHLVVWAVVVRSGGAPAVGRRLQWALEAIRQKTGQPPGC